jgi:peptidoglycan-N-acetylglucosamine deacetylase
MRGLSAVSCRLSGVLVAILITVSLSASERRVAFTFDDLPGVNAGCDLDRIAAMNRRLVGSIRKYKIPALGLVVDSNMCETLRDKLPSIYEIWLDAGLELGNHTASHRDLNKESLEAYQADTLLGEKTIRPLLEARGKAPRYFRYPFLRGGLDLDKKRAFEAFLREHGYVNAPVTIDNDEYVYAAIYARAMQRGDKTTANRVADDYIRYMESMFEWYEKLSKDTLGYELPQILLLHVNLLNADHLPRLVTMAKRRGYRFISIDEALRDPAYKRADDYVGPKGLSWLQRWAIADGKSIPQENDLPKWVFDLFRAR